MQTAHTTPDIEKLIEYRTAHYAAESEGATYHTNTPAHARFRFANPILCQLTAGRKVMRVGGSLPFAFDKGMVMYVPAQTDISVDLTAARADRPITCDCIEIEKGRFDAVVDEINVKLGMRGDGAFACPDWSAFVTLQAARADALNLPGLMSVFREEHSVFRDLRVDRGVETAILGLLQVHHRALLQVSAGADTGLGAAVRLIQRNLSHHVSADALADAAGMSKSTLHRHFQRHFGCSPARFANDKRIQTARRQLRETDTPIEVLAHDLGFSSPSHMTRVFRQITGETPAGFRRARLPSPYVALYDVA